ncbi:MAG: hypothetical protein RL617_126 [Pseudomonadota bacterium]|jgi:cytochrome c biogenesis protein
MRFAISALTIVCIASAIGTIVSQNAAPINYVNQFGAFWAEVFSRFDLFRVYNAPWFLLVMVLMLVSTSLCVVRNTPKMLREARAWRENVRESAFAAFRYRSTQEGLRPEESNMAIDRLEAALRARSFQVRRLAPVAAQSLNQSSPVLVAKKGGMGRLGYIATHLSIVIVCLGGLLDSEIPTRVMAWYWEKAPVQLSGLTHDTIPASGKLPQSTPSFRANLLIPEGERSDLAVLSQPTGAFLLDLPFELELKQFRIEYYNTGMPKLFASDVVLRDKESGETRTATIEVNKPLVHDGIAIYQSSFDDGGSALKLQAHPIVGPTRKPLEIALNVGQSIPLRSAQQTLGLEISGFKAINVESIGEGEPINEVFKDHVASVLSPAVNREKTKLLQNVGASFNYKLRDEAGQAKEFHSYMLPIELEGSKVFLTGVRASPDEQFRYLRIPADDKESLDEFLRIRAAMNDPELRRQASLAFARASAPEPMRLALAASAQRALDAVAEGGLNNLATILERSVPETERERAADVVVRMLSGAFWETWQLARLRDGLPRLVSTEDRQAFAQRALTAYSDALLLEAPLLVTMRDFTEVKASVFQVTRSPGQATVYLGSLLLVLGIFGMLYVQERRVWVWASGAEAPGGEMRLRMAASSPRTSLDFDREFSELKGVLEQAPSRKSL